MVELYLKGKVENVIKGKDFTNKETGEVKKGSIRLQFIAIDEVGGLQTIDVNVPEEYGDKAFDLKGKEVNLPVDIFASSSKVYYRAKSLW